jgi:hypothetical protein
LTKDWDETTLTWNNKPTFNSENAATCSVSSANKWYDFDVTKIT